MKSETWTIQQVFQERRQYKVPFYQRAYVWTFKGQWELLWTDIQGKADERLMGNKPAPHFLGAIVVEPQERIALRGVDTAHIIDGQQRLTTLQYVLYGFRLAVRDLGIKEVDSFLSSVLDNPHPDTMAHPEIEVFKVWPTFSEQAHFKTSMTAESLLQLKQRYPSHFTQIGNIRKNGGRHPGSLEAIWAFANWAQEWIKANGTASAEALIMAVLQDLKVVLISLEKGDDAQVIFETLNGRGAELHATDLIRNHLFMSMDQANEDSALLYETKWKQFESHQWKLGETRGRMTKPRLEWLVYNLIRAETGQEGDLSRLYVDFKDYTKTLTATRQLEVLDNYASHYLDLLSRKGDRPISRFGRRLAAYDATTTHALALKISTTDISRSEQEAIFNTLVSYIVRRQVCNLTTKSYNNIFMSLLRQWSKGPLTHEAMKALLGTFQSDTNRWPDDAEFTQALIHAPLYPGRLDTPRCRWFLTEMEGYLRRGKKSEEPEPPDLSNLDIDHLMPRSWFDHWLLPNETKGTRSEADAAYLLEITGGALTQHQALIRGRVKAVLTLGNLTLLNLSVNREAQNKAFPVKKKLLIEHTNLSLNVKLIAQESWDEEAILSRSSMLAEAALKVYPR
ncbi:DUF262 domain-containing HNH endonuclease family protein [Xanthomonas phaseoli pv. phaseoli]|uniref:DUF262 domain-containing protein n=1 Tax=Xanthomonas phaseoli TaxID=1985254 RepID=UPI00222673FF|nr:DUF262 domain-containing protein [Xanthomonas phaseoli]UZB11372.1 DUF262 domain-containing HNH endonuclease family protein [Xanthomonas phaseoli pv. phaseoli]UZB23964.1 DUF262 domain-containing HNH endonuclease family protein [Xanthomonas phaseoli pv. phaseoli]